MTDPVKPGEALKYVVNYNEVAPDSVLAKLLALIKPGSKVLELGCAAGSMTRILQSQHGCSVDAIEIDPIATEHARPYCERLIVDNLETVQWEAPFPESQTYDHVLAADVLEHLRDPGRVLQGVRKLLRPGGTIIVSTPNIAFAGVQAALRAGWFPYAPTGLLDDGHVHFFTRFELEALMLGSGSVPVERHAVRWGPGDSEFGVYWQQMSGEEKQQLLSPIDSNVYQWIISAELPSDSAWRRCVMFAPERPMIEQQINALHEQTNSLQQELQRAQTHLHQALEKTQLQRSQFSELDRQYQSLLQSSTATAATLQLALGSASWRVTAPLRDISARTSGIRLNFGKFIRSLRQEGVLATGRKVYSALAAPQATQSSAEAGSELLSGNWAAYQAWVAQYEQIPSDGAYRVTQTMEVTSEWPTFSVIMPVFNPQLSWLWEAVESVRNQWYPRWNLIIVDDASTAQRAELKSQLDRIAATDPRIHISYRDVNGHISRATNDGLENSSDEWVTFIDQDDRLAPHALWCFAEALRKTPQARVLYSDEDKITEHGSRLEPHFKPDWNPDLLLSYNYICHLVAYRREHVLSVGGFRPGLEGAQDYDLALRITEQCAPSEIQHIPRILYHWRVHSRSTSKNVGAKPYALLAGRQALQDALQRRGIPGSVRIDSDRAYQVCYDTSGNEPHVTLVVPTRNGGRMLQICIDSVISKTEYGHYDIVIIDNGSDQDQTLDVLQEYASHPRCTIVRDPRPFNYAALHNAVVPTVKGEFALLLNDDIEVIEPGWLREMVSVGIQPGVGIVGARLLYPNNTVQHGGVILVGGVAGHAHKHVPSAHWGYMMRCRVRQTMSAVTAACLLVRKAVYQEVGGMDELLAVAFNDVAFCLAVGSAGYRIVWTPYAELYHHESATRGHEHVHPEKMARFNREIQYMQATWGKALAYDPALNPNLADSREDFALARPPRLEALFPDSQQAY